MSVKFVSRLHATPATEQKDGRYPVVLQIIWGKNVRRKATGVAVLKDQWDYSSHQVGDHRRRAVLNKKIKKFLKRARSIYSEKFSDKEFDYVKFCKLLKKSDKKKKEKKKVHLAQYAIKVSADFAASGQGHSSRSYSFLANAILKVSPEDIPLSKLQKDNGVIWLKKFEKYFTSRGTRCYKHMVHLHALYGKAEREGLVDYKKTPWGGVWNPVGYRFNHLKKKKSNKINELRVKSVPTSWLQALATAIGLTESETKHLALWFFSFFMFGMNLTDIAKLKREHIRDGRWHYKRSKTSVGLIHGKPIPNNAMLIINRYGSKSKEGYVFDILTGKEKTALEIDKRIHYYSQYITKACKRISKRLKFEGYFTWYSARHTAINTALKLGANKLTVSRLADQDDVNTINNYAGTVEDEEVVSTMNMLNNVIEYTV